MLGGGTDILGAVVVPGGGDSAGLSTAKFLRLWHFRDAGGRRGVWCPDRGFVIMTGCDLEALTVLVPHLAGLAVERVSLAGRSVRRDTAVPAPPPAPPAKKVASWILTPPGDLAEDNRAALAQITARCEELKATRDLVRSFADMLCNRHGEQLEAWADQAEASPVSELRGFSKGLRNDWAAVTAGLTVSYSAGAVEGHVNRKDDQTTDVRTRQTRPATSQARPARRLTRSRQLRQSHFLMAMDTCEPLSRRSDLKRLLPY